MGQVGMRKEDHKVLNLRNVVRATFSFSGMRQFTMGAAPQIFVIWIGIAVLLKASAFVELFNGFGRYSNSPFFTVTSVGAGQPVDFTPFFLIGIGAFLWMTLLAIVLGSCIKICSYFAKNRPVKLEAALARFSGKMANEVSSCLGHCAAATVVLLVEGNLERYGESAVRFCAVAAVAMYIFAGMVYRKD